MTETINATVWCHGVWHKQGSENVLAKLANYLLQT